MDEEGELQETFNEGSRTSRQLNRIEAALAGQLPLRELTRDELVAFNTAVNEAIERRLAIIDWQAMLSRRGLYSVGMDEHGQIVVYPPDSVYPTAGPGTESQDQADGGV